MEKKNLSHIYCLIMSQDKVLLVNTSALSQILTETFSCKMDKRNRKYIRMARNLSEEMSGLQPSW